MKPKEWLDKNERLNFDKQLRRCFRVEDCFGHRGIVVKIEAPDIDDLTDENHGTISVWQEDRFEYGADNCEHYSFKNWQRYLRIIEE